MSMGLPVVSHHITHQASGIAFRRHHCVLITHHRLLITK